VKDFLRFLRIKWVTPTNVKSLIIASAAVLLATGLFLTGFLKQLDYYWLNFLTVTYSTEKSEEKRVAIVEILDRTYEVCGTTITREMYLKCLQHIEELGARVIVFDIFLRSGSSKETDSKCAELSREHDNILYIINREGTSTAFVEPRFPREMRERLILIHPLLNKDSHETSEIIRGFTAFQPRPGKTSVHQDRTEG